MLTSQRRGRAVLATIGLSTIVIGLACRKETITDVPVAVASIELSTTSISLNVGDRATLTATPKSASGKSLTARSVQWSVSPPSVASIQGNVVTATGPGTATITATAGEATKTIALTVSARPHIAVSPTSVTFNAFLGVNPPAQTVAITNSGQGTLAGLGQTVQNAGASPWLSTTLNSATAPTSLTVAANVAGVAAGQYTTNVILSSTVADNSGLQIPVTLNVTQTFTLTILLSGNGSGQITATPAPVSGSINCTLTNGALGGSCTATYVANTQVTVVATSTSGQFSGWSGSGCTGTGSCVLTMNQNTTLSASFGSPGTLTIIGNGNGTITSSPAGINCTITNGVAAASGCTANFPTTASVVLTANANAGSSFGGFFGDCPDFSQCTLTMSAARTAVAVFNTIQTTTLTNGVAVPNLTGAQGSQRFFRITVPAGQTRLLVTTTGGTGDADLYVRFGQAPTFAARDCVSETATTAETCVILNPTAGDWFIQVFGFSAQYSGVTLTATFAAPTAASPVISAPTSALAGLNTCSFNDGSANGSLINLLFNFTDPNGDVVLSGEPVTVGLVFQPGASSFTSRTSVFASSGTGSSGSVTIQRCIRFGSSTSANYTLILQDAAGNISNSITGTITKPNGANSVGGGAIGSGLSNDTLASIPRKPVSRP